MGSGSDTRLRHNRMPVDERGASSPVTGSNRTQRRCSGPKCPSGRPGPGPGAGSGIVAQVTGLRLLTLAPRIDERSGVLRARTSLLLTLVTAGAFFRQVLVDKRSGYVVIERRLFWLFSSKRVIPFRMIRRI